MKHFKSFAISRAGIISLVGIGVILFTISSIENTYKPVAYEVSQSNITISGFSGLNTWKLKSASIQCEGDFEIKNDELMNIDKVNFIAPIQDFISDDQQVALFIKDFFIKNNCTQIAFKQEYLMVLPIMKMVHMIGEFSMVSNNHTIPFQLHYKLKDNQTLRISGKQTIKMSEFGVKMPAYAVGAIDDEIEVEIDLVLIRKKIS